MLAGFWVLWGGYFLSQLLPAPLRGIVLLLVLAFSGFTILAGYVALVPPPAPDAGPAPSTRMP
jgi:hypothetical protein